MSYVPVHQELPRHRKVRKLGRLLNLKPWETLGLLVSVWVYALEFAPDGVIDSVEDLADVVGWEAGAETLTDALRDAGFMDGSSLHGWEGYGGKLERRKQANTERMRKARAGGVQDTCDTRAAHNGDTCEASKGVNKNSLTGVALENATPASRLSENARKTVEDWQARADDPDFFSRLLESFSEDHISDVMRRLSIHQSAGHPYKKMRAALGNWMKRETPDPRRVDESTLTKRQRFCLQAIHGDGFEATLTDDPDELHELKTMVLGGLTESEVLSWQ